MSWTPDNDDAPWSPERDRGDDDAAEIVMIPDFAVPLRLEAIDHREAPEGALAYASFLDGGSADTPIARGVLPAPVVRAVLASTLFAEPVRIAWSVREEPDHRVRAELAALLPMAAVDAVLRTVREDDEPWRASLSGESLGGMPGDGATVEEALTPFPLGVVYRLPENREYREDLEREGIALLVAVLEGGAMTVDAKRVENFLGGL